MEEEEEVVLKSIGMVDVGEKVVVHLNYMVGLTNPKTMKMEGMIKIKRLWY